MLADLRLYPVKGLPLGKLWKLLILLLFLFRGLKRTLKGIFKIFPPVFLDRLSGSGKGVTATGKLCLDCFIKMFLPHSAQQPVGHKG